MQDDTGFSLSPRDYVRVFKCNKDFEFISPAFGLLNFIKEDRGFIICEREGNLFRFNSEGNVCWWNEIDKTWNYDDESDCMIYPANTGDYYVDVKFIKI